MYAIRTEYSGLKIVFISCGMIPSEMRRFRSWRDAPAICAKNLTEFWASCGSVRSVIRRATAPPFTTAFLSSAKSFILKKLWRVSIAAFPTYGPFSKCNRLTRESTASLFFIKASLSSAFEKRAKLAKALAAEASTSGLWDDVSKQMMLMTVSPLISSFFC